MRVRFLCSHMGFVHGAVVRLRFDVARECETSE